MLAQRNSQFKTQYQHRLNSKKKNMSLGREESRMFSPVQMRHGRFEAMQSFTTFDWLLAEKIVSFETNFEKLDSRQVAQLLLNIYPKQKTLLHMITARFTKDDQSRSVALTKFMFEEATNFNDQEVARVDTHDQFIVPMIANHDGKTPL